MKYIIHCDRSYFEVEHAASECEGPGYFIAYGANTIFLHVSVTCAAKLLPFRLFCSLGE